MAHGSIDLLVSGSFPIPMRGNEFSSAIALQTSLTFPIPMRGNELFNVRAASQTFIVSDPHEG